MVNAARRGCTCCFVKETLGSESSLYSRAPDAKFIGERRAALALRSSRALGRLKKRFSPRLSGLCLKETPGCGVQPSSKTPKPRSQSALGGRGGRRAPRPGCPCLCVRPRPGGPCLCVRPPSPERGGGASQEPAQPQSGNSFPSRPQPGPVLLRCGPLSGVKF